MSVKSIYRINNKGLSIDVVYYRLINGGTIHIEKYYSQDQGGFIDKKQTKEKLVGKHHRYYMTYESAWEEIRARLEARIRANINPAKYQDMLFYWETQHPNTKAIWNYTGNMAT